MAAEPAKMTSRYRLASGMIAIRRDGTTVQVGLSPDRGRIVHNAPPETVAVLAELDGSASLGSVLARHCGDPLVWTALAGTMTDAGLLTVDPPLGWEDPIVNPEAGALEARDGADAAARALQARRDALVVVYGTGRIACGVAVTLATAGIGHVHHRPDRPVRAADTPGAPLGPCSAAGSGPGDARATDSGPVPSILAPGARTAASAPSAPAKRDARYLAGRLLAASATIRVSAPAAQQRPDLVVLAGDGPPPVALAAELVADRVPHLSVYADPVEAVIGPLVLPGRSSCLLCADRHRTDDDPCWPQIADHVRSMPVVPPAGLAALAAAISAAQALEHIDALTLPVTVDGTLHLPLGATAPRRRSWEPHPDCGCRIRPNRPRHPQEMRGSGGVDRE